MIFNVGVLLRKCSDISTFNIYHLLLCMLTQIVQLFREDLKSTSRASSHSHSRAKSIMGADLKRARIRPGAQPRLTKGEYMLEVKNNGGIADPNVLLHQEV